MAKTGYNPAQRAEEARRIKQDIDLGDFLEAKYGFAYDDRNSWKKTGRFGAQARVYNNDSGMTVSVGRQSDGNYVWYSFGSGEGGSIIDFISKNDNISIKDAFQVAREYLGSEIYIPAPRFDPKQVNAQTITEFKVDKASDFSWLEVRGLTPETYKSPLFADTYGNDKTGSKNRIGQSVAFKMSDRDGKVIAVEVKNQFPEEYWQKLVEKGKDKEARFTHTQQLAGSRKALALWKSAVPQDPKQIMVFEHALDAMSYYQLNKDNKLVAEQTLFVASMGTIGKDQVNMISELQKKHNIDKIVGAFDLDAAGRAYSLQLLSSEELRGQNKDASVFINRRKENSNTIGGGNNVFDIRLSELSAKDLATFNSLLIEYKVPVKNLEDNDGKALVVNYTEGNYKKLEGVVREFYGVSNEKVDIVTPENAVDFNDVLRGKFIQKSDEAMQTLIDFLEKQEIGYKAPIQTIKPEEFESKIISVSDNLVKYKKIVIGNLDADTGKVNLHNEYKNLGENVSKEIKRLEDTFAPGGRTLNNNLPERAKLTPEGEIIFGGQVVAKLEEGGQDIDVLKMDDLSEQGWSEMERIRMAIKDKVDPNLYLVVGLDEMSIVAKGHQVGIIKDDLSIEITYPKDLPSSMRYQVDEFKEILEGVKELREEYRQVLAEEDQPIRLTKDATGVMFGNTKMGDLLFNEEKGYSFELYEQHQGRSLPDSFWDEVELIVEHGVDKYLSMKDASDSLRIDESSIYYHGMEIGKYNDEKGLIEFSVPIEGNLKEALDAVNITDEFYEAPKKADLTPEEKASYALEVETASGSRIYMYENNNEIYFNSDKFVLGTIENGEITYNLSVKDASPEVQKMIAQVEDKLGIPVESRNFENLLEKPVVEEKVAAVVSGEPVIEEVDLDSKITAAIKLDAHMPFDKEKYDNLIENGQVDADNGVYMIEGALFAIHDKDNNKLYLDEGRLDQGEFTQIAILLESQLKAEAVSLKELDEFSPDQHKSITALELEYKLIELGNDPGVFAEQIPVGADEKQEVLVADEAEAEELEPYFEIISQHDYDNNDHEKSENFYINAYEDMDALAQDVINSMQELEKEDGVSRNMVYMVDFGDFENNEKLKEALNSYIENHYYTELKFEVPELKTELEELSKFAENSRDLEKYSGEMLYSYGNEGHMHFNNALMEKLQRGEPYDLKELRDATVAHMTEKSEEVSVEKPLSSTAEVQAQPAGIGQAEIDYMNLINDLSKKVELQADILLINDQPVGKVNIDSKELIVDGSFEKDMNINKQAVLTIADAYSRSAGLDKVSFREGFQPELDKNYQDAFKTEKQLAEERKEGVLFAGLVGNMKDESRFSRYFKESEGKLIINDFTNRPLAEISDNMIKPLGNGDANRVPIFISDKLNDTSSRVIVSQSLQEGLAYMKLKERDVKFKDDVMLVSFPDQKGKLSQAEMQQFKVVLSHAAPQSRVDVIGDMTFVGQVKTAMQVVNPEAEVVTAMARTGSYRNELISAVTPFVNEKASDQIPGTAISNGILNSRDFANSGVERDFQNGLMFPYFDGKKFDGAMVVDSLEKQSTHNTDKGVWVSDVMPIEKPHRVVISSDPVEALSYHVENKPGAKTVYLAFDGTVNDEKLNVISGYLERIKPTEVVIANTNQLKEEIMPKMGLIRFDQEKIRFEKPVLSENSYADSIQARSNASANVQQEIMRVLESGKWQVGAREVNNSEKHIQVNKIDVEKTIKRDNDLSLN